MSEVPEEIKNAIETLEKYWFKLESHDEWQQLHVEGLPLTLEAYDFILKPPQPLTLDRISAFDKTYAPRVSLDGEPISMTVYDEGKRQKLASAKLLFATREEAERVAQKWIDEAGETVW